MPNTTLTTVNNKAQVFVKLSRPLAPGETLTATSSNPQISTVTQPIVGGTDSECEIAAVGPAGTAQVVIKVLLGGSVLASFEPINVTVTGSPEPITAVITVFPHP